MIRLLARLTLNVLSNALGLLAASLLVDGFSINGLSFVLALLLFSLSTAVLSPLVMKITLQSAPFLMGGIALVTTFVGLLITTIFSDGISIDGVSAWVISTLVIWLFSIVGNVLLPLVIFKKTLKKIKES